MNTNKYYDIHPFLLGYSSLWIANVFSNMETKTVGCALALFIYMVILYHEKEKVEKRVNTEITKTMLYIVAIPVSAFFVILYLFEQQTTAFVAYYACLFYGIYRNDLKKEAWMLAVVVCCNSVLLMLYAFQFVPFGWIEKTIFLITFVCGILWIPVRGKKTKARG